MIGCGHSKGGHLTARVELLRPGTYAGMVLCDPVLPPPHAYGPVDPEILEHPDRHPVAQRRNRYAGWQDFHAHLKDREPYSLWRPEILVDYCRHGVQPASDGDGVELACAPVTEASIYITSRQSSILDRLGVVACPVTVLRAKDVPEEPGGRLNFMRSTTWGGLAGLFPKGRDVYLPDLTHFIPMQAPDIVARHIAEMSSAAAGDG